MKYKHTKQELEVIVKKSLSIAQVCRELNIRPSSGGNYKTLHQKLKDFEIDYSHFTGKAWNVGDRFRPVLIAKDLESILIIDSNASSHKLKLRLIREGYKDKICENCLGTTWLNKPIPLELHHVNGINTDNRIENLSILCPNCHAITETYRGKNKLSALSEKRDVEYRKFRESLTDNADGNPEPSLINEEGAETIHDKPK